MCLFYINLLSVFIHDLFKESVMKRTEIVIILCVPSVHGLLREHTYDRGRILNLLFLMFLGAKASTAERNQCYM